MKTPDENWIFQYLFWNEIIIKNSTKYFFHSLKKTVIIVEENLKIFQHFIQIQLKLNTHIIWTTFIAFNKYILYTKYPSNCENRLFYFHFLTINFKRIKNYINRKCPCYHRWELICVNWLELFRTNRWDVCTSLNARRQLLAPQCLHDKIKLIKLYFKQRKVDNINTF